MRVLRNLAGTAVEEAYVEPGIHHHTVGVDLAKGKFVSGRFGPSGLVLSNGQAEVAIPFAELAALLNPPAQPDPAPQAAPAADPKVDDGSK